MNIRWLALAALLVVSFVSAACAPSAAPSPTAAPPKPTTASPAKATEVPAAKPAATASGVAKPGATASAKPAASSDWQAEWDKTLAAAKKEGKVVVTGGNGEVYRNAVMAFQKAYPDIQLEFTGSAGADFAPKILAEREAGQYLWDAFMSGSTTMLTALRPKGALDPLKPALMLPEILDDSKWFGGFDNNWMDQAKSLVFSYTGQRKALAFVNRDVIPESELNSFEQLLDPKWKGKMISLDPRTPGPAQMYTAHLLIVKGEDWVRKLFTQDVTINKDGRQAAEAVVRGRYPIGLFFDSAQFELLVQEGVAGQVKPLDPDSQAGSCLNSSMGNIVLINQAPHPNAAKVYINWLLSQAGQRAYVEATAQNSRRLDVPGPAETEPRAELKQPDIQKEEFLPYSDQVRNITVELLK